GEQPHGTVQELTGRMEHALSEVTLQAERPEMLALIAQAEQIFSSDDENALEAETLAQTFERRRRFVTGYSLLRARTPERIATLEARITRYEAELREAGLDARRLSPRDFAFAAVVRYTLKSLALFALLLPAALVGTLVHYPAYRLAGFFAMRFSKREDDLFATIKVLSSMLFFPLTWLLLFIGLTVVWDGRTA